MISKVQIDPTGRSAEFLNSEGARGFVNLFNDPSLLKLLQDNKIDISVMQVQPGNPLLNLLSSLAFPLFMIAGIYFITRRLKTGMSGMNDQQNPFNIGRSRAKAQMDP